MHEYHPVGLFGRVLRELDAELVYSVSMLASVMVRDGVGLLELAVYYMPPPLAL